MKDRPILFSAPMVRAILEGRKTQTRRVVKPQPDLQESFSHQFPPNGPRTSYGYSGWYPNELHPKGRHYGSLDHLRKGLPKDFCPHGVPGNRLWVRETWWNVPEPSLSELRDGADTWPEPIGPQEQRVAYAADADDPVTVRQWGWKLRPSIFMPRWASRITLEITDVRVQRVQEIGEEDAIAEGLDRHSSVCNSGLAKYPHGIPAGVCADRNCDCAIRWYRDLWDSINAKTHPWDANPWVWAITFKRTSV